MTYQVVVTAAAKQDLHSAYLWAAERALHTAALWLQRFEAELQTLAKSPERFQLAPENALVDHLAAHCLNVDPAFPDLGL